jgi:hypothetical protein
VFVTVRHFHSSTELNIQAETFPRGGYTLLPLTANVRNG